MFRFANNIIYWESLWLKFLTDSFVFGWNDMMKNTNLISNYCKVELYDILLGKADEWSKHLNQALHTK